MRALLRIIRLSWTFARLLIRLERMKRRFGVDWLVRINSSFCSDYGVTIYVIRPPRGPTIVRLANSLDEVWALSEAVEAIEVASWPS